MPLRGAYAMNGYIGNDAYNEPIYRNHVRISDNGVARRDILKTLKSPEGTQAANKALKSTKGDERK